MDAPTQKKPPAMPTRQPEAKPLSVEGSNAEEKTDNKVLTKSKLNPDAKEFVPSNRQARRSHACEITAPKDESSNGSPMPPKQLSTKATVSEKSTEVLQNLLNDFKDRNKQLASINISITKTTDKVGIELICEDKVMCNVAKANDTQQDEVITIDLNSTTLVKSKQQKLLVSKLFRRISDIIKSKAKEDTVEQSQCNDDEEEIANQIERIKMLHSILKPDFKANEAIVQRTIHSFCEKLGIPETELSEMLEDSKDERNSATYTSEQLSDSRAETFCASEITNEVFKFECFEDYDVHINELSESDSKVTHFDTTSIDAPPTTPALSATALNDMNLKSESKANRNECLANNTIKNVGRNTLRDAVVDKPRNASRLRSGAISHKNQNQSEQKKFSVVVEAAKPTTRASNREPAIKWMPLEQGEKKKLTKFSAVRKDEKSASKSSSEKSSNEACNGGTKSTLAYKTIATKTKEKRIVPSQKLPPRGTITTAMREKEAKKANMLWKL